MNLGIGDFESCVITNTAIPASISVAKNADPTDTNNDGIIDAGDTINCTFTVTNTGSLTLDSIAVQDAKVGAVSCPQATLAPNDVETCTASYVITGADQTAGAVDNTATASAVPAGETATVTSGPSSTHTPVTTPNPAITVLKSADPSDAAHFNVGQQITYSFEVTNAGNVPLSDVAVQDGDFTGSGVLSPIDCPADTLAPAGQMTCAATYTITQDDLDSGQVSNTATATGTPPTGQPVGSTPSQVTIPADQEPELTLIKSASTNAVQGAGETIGYTFTVTNTGKVTLHDVNVDETAFSGSGAAPVVSCPSGPLPPQQQRVCTAIYTATQADIDAGVITNTAVAAASAPDDSAVSSDPSSVRVTAEADPAMSLTKSADPTSVTAAGATVTYTYVATNTGNVTLSDVHIDEGAFSGTGTLSALDCPTGPITLAPDDDLTCTATYTLTQADVDAGSVTNTGTAAGSPPSGDPITSDPATATIDVPAAPALTVIKSADPSDAAHFTVGQVITYTFVVTNTGNVTLSGISVDDATFTGSGSMSAIACPVTTLAPTEQTACTAMYTLTQDDLDAGQVSNTATAAGTPPTGDPVDSPPSQVTIPADQQPALTLVKRAAPDTVHKAGEAITYTFTFTNTGNVTIRDLAVQEGAFSGTGALSATTCPTAVLAPGAHVDCTAAYKVTQADVDSGTIRNTATGSGTAPNGDPVSSDPSTAEVSIDASGALALTKTATAVDANHDGRVDPGDRIVWALIVTNTGAATVHHVSVSDPTAGPVRCPHTSLAPGRLMTCTVAAHAVSAADAGHAITNTATARGHGVAGVSVTSDPDTAGVRVPAAQPGPVAETGSDVAGEIRLAGLLLGGGVLALLSARRRRPGRRRA
ncbi:MAG TPA: hypothetical protein VE442_05920 [Jatrophihabitans sp.]|nr:hypothetical protein [Jatrophihabitans sp.]